jgi:5-methylcytosine-specific restriction protein B
VIPENITKEHLLKAIEEIDKEGVPVGRQSWMYDLNYKDKLYPPKVIISFANKYANGEELDHTSFKGGLKTPGFELLKKAGFQIVKKSVENNIDYFDQLKLFLDQSKTSNLKTKHYQKRYGELKLKVSFGQGVSARIPWISFLLEPNTTSNGIYPVYLLYKKQNILILAYGISETEAPIITWDILQKKTISDYFKEKKLEKPERYGDSYLFKVYDDLENLNRDTINNDLGDILDQYRQSAILYKNNKVDLFNSKKQAASIDISSFYESCKKTGLVFNYSIIQRFLSSLVTKPFVLLSACPEAARPSLLKLL